MPRKRDLRRRLVRQFGFSGYSAMAVSARGSLPFHMALTGFEKGVHTADSALNSTLIESGNSDSQISVAQTWDDETVRFAHVTWIDEVGVGPTQNDYVNLGTITVTDSTATESSVDLDTLEPELLESGSVYKLWRVVADIEDGDYELIVTVKQFNNVPCVQVWAELVVIVSGAVRTIDNIYWGLEDVTGGRLRYADHRKPSRLFYNEAEEEWGVYLWESGTTVEHNGKASLVINHRMRELDQGNNTLIFIAKQSEVFGGQYTVESEQAVGNSQPTTAAFSNGTITITLGTDSNGDIDAVPQDVKDAIEADADCHAAIEIETYGEDILSVWDSLELHLGNYPPNRSITFTALAPGTAGQLISLNIIDPDDTDQELEITLDGLEITISLATDSSGEVISTVAQIRDAFNASEASSIAVATLQEGASGTDILYGQNSNTPLSFQAWWLQWLHYEQLSGQQPDDLVVKNTNSDYQAFRERQNGINPTTVSLVESSINGDIYGNMLSCELLLWYGDSEDTPTQESVDNGPLGNFSVESICQSEAAGPVFPINDPDHPVDAATKIVTRYRLNCGRQIGYTGLLLDGQEPEQIIPQTEQAILHRANSFDHLGSDGVVYLTMGDIDLIELFARQCFNVRNVGTTNAVTDKFSNYFMKHGKISTSPIGLIPDGYTSGQWCDDHLLRRGHAVQPEHQYWCYILTGDPTAKRWFEGFIDRQSVDDWTGTQGREPSGRLNSLYYCWQYTHDDLWKDLLVLQLDKITRTSMQDQLNAVHTPPIWRPNPFILSGWALEPYRDSDSEIDSILNQLEAWRLEAHEQATMYGPNAGIMPLSAGRISPTFYADRINYIQSQPTNIFMDENSVWHGYPPSHAKFHIEDQWPFIRDLFPSIIPAPEYNSYPARWSGNYLSNSNGNLSCRIEVVHPGGMYIARLQGISQTRSAQMSFRLKTSADASTDIWNYGYSETFRAGDDPIEIEVGELPHGTYYYEVRVYGGAPVGPVAPNATSERSFIFAGTTYNMGTTIGTIESPHGNVSLSGDEQPASFNGNNVWDGVIEPFSIAVPENVTITGRSAVVNAVFENNLMFIIGE